MTTAYGSSLYGIGLYGGTGSSTLVSVTGARATATSVARPGRTFPARAARATAAATARAGFVVIAPPPAPRLNFPTLFVMIDITNAPTNPTRQWTNISAYVRQISLSRDGRSNETERTQTGSLSMLLDNRDGRFTGTNTSGPYYPNLTATRWLQVRAVWQGVTYNRWTGLVDTITTEWPAYGKDATAVIQGSTALKVLNLAPLDGNVFAAEKSGARVAHTLAAARVTAGSIDTGAADMGLFAPQPGDNTKALDHLQAIEGEEQGIVFTDGSGVVQFHDRHHRFGATTIGTLGDQPGELPYMNPGRADDDHFLINSAHRNTSAQSVNVGTTIPDYQADPDFVDATGSAYDSASGTAHFVRDDTQTLLTDIGNEAQANAEAFVFRYKAPAPRVSSVDIIGPNTPSNWPTILGARNSDQFHFIRRYPGAGTIEQTVFLEQVSEQITPNEWNTTWLLSPGTIDAYWNSVAWRVGDPVYGQFMSGSIAIGW